MTEEQYRKWSNPFRKYEKLKKWLIFYNHAATLMLAAAYFTALLWLGILWDARFWRILIVPAIGFTLITLLRKLINRKRPYETLDIEPLMEKKNQGNSCPSRHIFSAFAISTALFYLFPTVGILAAFFSTALAMTRVIAGVHFPSDVIIGAIVGVALTALGLYLPLPI